MNYSELVDAVDRGDRAKTNALLKDLTPRLIRFLRIHMNATKQDAEDCTQQALLKSIKIIKEGNIRDAERILSFLLTSCRNNYLNLVKKDQEESFDDLSDDFHRKPQQLFSLLEKERRQLLEWCIEHLSESYRTFITYWFTHPNSDSKAASTHFNITKSNVWTRKHRIIKKLNECYREKSNI